MAYTLQDDDDDDDDDMHICSFVLIYCDVIRNYEAPWQIMIVEKCITSSTIKLYITVHGLGPLACSNSVLDSEIMNLFRHFSETPCTGERPIIKLSTVSKVIPVL
jgi:hypothetical protein